MFFNKQFNTGWFYSIVEKQAFLLTELFLKSVMIHRQVHLPIPCYDFCFL